MFLKRIILIVLDSAGIGECPDSNLYNDFGVNTIGNIAAKIKNFSLPNLESMGLGNIDGFNYPNKVMNPTAAFGKLMEKSSGKDTTTGHWEISGLILEKPFPVYPNGFPIDLITEYEKRIGSKILGNYASSGTDIIRDLGDEHIKTGYPIVYTSADSVFQIAAHEAVIPIEKLYELCEIARELLKGDHSVGRVIARPFEGNSGEFKRTDRRKDFSLKPIGKTMLDAIKEAGMNVKAVGKIEDIFCGQGITHSIHTHGNMDGFDRTIEYMEEDFSGLIFTNLVDFDMLYGHRNDVEGYGKALMEFDARLPELLDKMNDEDLLMITADHGCDPTTKGTDHSREYVPILVYKNGIKGNVNLHIRNSFSDICATTLDYLGLKEKINGLSFLELIK
jgi:phosphopentomutase